MQQAPASDTANSSFELAAGFIRFTGSSVFLTGKAGTGKTTFLKYCREQGFKNTAVVAPTGVAAIHAGGATIHSFFQLPTMPFIPESKGYGAEDTVVDKHALLGKVRLNSERKEVINKLELLIIDEVSMVRCDLLDAVDCVMRHVRNKPDAPFGGVQVLLIGDLFQLPPVAGEEVWELLSPYYRTPFFFGSRVMENNPPVYIELEKVYRQRDEGFISLLNQVRNNTLDEKAYRIFESRYMPDFIPAENEKYITLTSHNHKADKINARELDRLSGQPKVFHAELTGEFNEKAYPAEKELLLKIGAQVMFIKNDTDRARRYFNGKIGTVCRLEDDRVFVQCEGDAAVIEVRTETWKNLRYRIDRSTRQVSEEELGSFTQFPLRLAWAITIHKSQGLTFERAIIDAGDSFAAGQVYVALSRCTSLEGMVLKSRIRASGLFTDPQVLAYAQQHRSANPEKLLEEAQRIRQQEEISELFRFNEWVAQCRELVALTGKHIDALSKSALPWMLDIQKIVEQTEDTARKFAPQLSALLLNENTPVKNPVLQERLVAAARHFTATLEPLEILLKRCPAETDSKIVAQEMNNPIRILYENVHLRRHLLSGIIQGYDQLRFQEHLCSYRKPASEIDLYAAGKTSVSGTGVRSELQQLLRRKRDEICKDKNLPLYRVVSNAGIEEMVLCLPQSREELKKISGFGEIKTRQFGDEFLEIVARYCYEHDLHGDMGALPVKEKKKKIPTNKKTGNTRSLSFELFRQGKTISEIAAERKLTVSTIEGHLAVYVESGELKINELVSSAKRETVESAIKMLGTKETKPIYEFCGGLVGYGEIRLVLAAHTATPHA
jgi:hypothetical protein